MSEKPVTEQAKKPEAKNIVGGCLLIMLIAAIWIWLGIVGIIVIGAIFFMIFLHELGHLITARRAGMKASDFFIGFGPKIWSFKTSKTEYGIRALPLGAYVKIIGMTNLEEVDPKEEHLTYRSKPFRQKLMVVSAGSIAHFLIAAISLWVLFSFGGFWSFSQPPDEWNVGAVADNSSAEASGLMPGDTIITLNESEGDGKELYRTNYVAFRNSILAIDPGERVKIGILRDGEERIISIASLGDNGNNQGMLGISPGLAKPSPSGPIVGAIETGKETFEASKLTFKALGTFFYPPNLWEIVSDPFIGDEPVQTEEADNNRATTIFGIARISLDLASLGAWRELLAIYALVNIFIGIFNMLPFPPLDGGHAVVATYEKLRSRNGIAYRVDYNKIVPYQIAVICVLLIIFGSVLYEDIANPINIGR